MDLSWNIQYPYSEITVQEQRENQQIRALNDQIARIMNTTPSSLGGKRRMKKRRVTRRA